MIECIPHRPDLSGKRMLATARSIAIACVIVIVSVSQAQSPPVSTAARMEFDVASIRENKSGLPPSGVRPTSNFPLGPGAMYSPNGGAFRATNQPLWVYIMFAYKMTDHQVESLRKQLPEWALTKRFDVEAKTDNHEATKDDMRLMMQALLAERFKLAIHTTTEEVSAYGLMLAKPGKTGPKLQLHPASDTSCSNTPTSAPEAGSSSQASPRTVAGGFPVVCGGAAVVPSSAPGRIAVGYRNVPLRLIALQMTLMGGLDRPVIDQTGLTGNVDFLIEFAPEPPPDVASRANFESAGPTFRQALLEQDGLKLISQKGTVDVIIVDHVEYPSPN